MEQIAFSNQDIGWLYLTYGRTSVRRAMKNINRGSAALDDYTPGWANTLAPETIDLSCASLCICGQVFGAKMARSVPAQFSGFSKRLGFDVMDKPLISYALLDELWTTFVITRAKRGRRIEFSIPA